MEESRNNLNGSLAIVGVGVAVGVLAFAIDGLKWLLIVALVICVLGGGIAFYKSMNPES